MKIKAALLIIDVQNDFCPGGALPIPAGDQVIAPLNRVAQYFNTAGLPVLASRDWHSPQTAHFRDFGGDWPVHCVAGSHGAAFHPDLVLPQGTIIITKGMDPSLPGYSAFEGTNDQGTPLAELLRGMGIEQLYLGGLATDYCVLSTVLDALLQGFAVNLLTDSVAGVELNPGDTSAALVRMNVAGAKLATVQNLPEMDY